MRIILECDDATLADFHGSEPSVGSLLRIRDVIYSVAKTLYVYDPTTDDHECFVLLAAMPEHWFGGIRYQTMGDTNATHENRCDVPPHGWYCTRPRGHDGPCAALPIKAKGEEETRCTQPK